MWAAASTPEERDANALAEEIRRLLAQRRAVEIDGKAAEVPDEVEYHGEIEYRREI